MRRGECDGDGSTRTRSYSSTRRHDGAGGPGRRRSDLRLSHDGDRRVSVDADGAEGNPEELIGAAHAACFSMALSFALTNAGHPPTSVSTNAVVHLTRTDTGFAIPKIDLVTEGVVPGIDEATFESTAEDAKKNCPVSKALAGVEITLQASLKPA